MDELTQSLLLENCRAAGDVTRGRLVYSRMRENGYVPPIRCCRWLMQGRQRTLG